MERNSHTDDIYANCIRSYLAENKDLRDQIKKVNNEVMDHKDQISVISQNLANERQNHNATRNKCHKLENELYNLEQTNKGIINSANERINLLNNELKSLLKENGQLKDQLLFYQNENKQILSRNKKLEIELSEKESTIRILQEQIDDLRKNEIVLKNKISESQALYSTYFKKCQDLQMELDLANQNNQQNNKMVSNLQIRISSLEDTARRTKSQESVIIEKDLIIDDLHNQLIKANSKCQAVTDALQHSQDQLRESMHNDQENAALKSRIDVLEMTIKKYENELLEKNHMYTESLVKQSRTIDQLRRQLSNSLTSHDYEMMKSEASEARRLANSLGQDYHSIKQTFDSISNKVSNLESSIRAANSAPASPTRVTTYENDYADEIDDNFKRNLISSDYL